jgi:hypothetical protein
MRSSPRPFGRAYCFTGTCYVTVPAGSGTVPVRIETGGGTSPVTPATMFTYHPKPTVTSIAPSSGPAAGGNTAVIGGTNLSTVISVHFGDEPSTVVSGTDTAVTVVVAPGYPGMRSWPQVVTRGGLADVPHEVSYLYE